MSRSTHVRTVNVMQDSTSREIQGDNLITMSRRDVGSIAAGIFADDQLVSASANQPATSR